MDKTLDQIDIQNCQACGCAMDVSSLAPFTNVQCPECGEHTRVKCEVGGYKLKNRQGAGGMSLVFAAEDVTLGREVAIKILNEEYSMNEKRIAEFEKEAQITAAISHPHVVRVYTVGQAFGRYYIAMELVRGGSLEQKMTESGALDDELVVDLAIQVVEGLNAAHQAGLIHRDIKPGNILFDRQGHAKIVDFGLALVTQGGKAKADEIWATPYYVPPEALDCLEEDLRSDIYALGASLYHALAGIPPFTTETRSTTELRQIKTGIIPLQEAAPQVNSYLADVVDKAMAFEPQDRYQNYEEMLAALHHAQHAIRTGETHHVSTRSARMKRRQDGKPWILMAVAAAVLFIGAVVGALNFLKDDDSDEADAGIPVAATNHDNEAKQKLIAAELRAARQLMVAKNYEGAAKRYLELTKDEYVSSETVYWVGLQAAIASWLEGRSADARFALKLVRDRQMRDGGPKSDVDRKLDHATALLSQYTAIKPDQIQVSEDALDGMLLFAAALKNWEQGMLDDAAQLFQTVKALRGVSGSEELAQYRSLTNDYLADYQAMKSFVSKDGFLTVDEAKLALPKVDALMGSLKTKGRARFNVQQWRLQVEDQVRVLSKQLAGAKPEKPTPEVAEPVIDPWAELQQEVVRSIIEMNYAPAIALLKKAQPTDKERVKWCNQMIYLMTSAAGFLDSIHHELNGKPGKFEIQLRNGSGKFSEFTKVEPAGIQVMEGGKPRLLAWKEILPDTLLSMHTQLTRNGQNDFERMLRLEQAISYAWLAGEKEKAKVAAAKLVDQSPTFKLRWAEIMHLFGGQ